MPIKEADKSYDHKKIEKKIQNFWVEEDTFSKYFDENGIKKIEKKSLTDL